MRALHKKSRPGLERHNGCFVRGLTLNEGYAHIDMDRRNKMSDKKNASPAQPSQKDIMNAAKADPRNGSCFVEGAMGIDSASQVKGNPFPNTKNHSGPNRGGKK